MPRHGASWEINYSVSLKVQCVEITEAVSPPLTRIYLIFRCLVHEIATRCDGQSKSVITTRRVVVFRSCHEQQINIVRCKATRGTRLPLQLTECFIGSVSQHCGHLNVCPLQLTHFGLACGCKQNIDGISTACFDQTQTDDNINLPSCKRTVRVCYHK